MSGGSCGLTMMMMMWAENRKWWNVESWRRNDPRVTLLREADTDIIPEMRPGTEGSQVKGSSAVLHSLHLTAE